MAPTLPPIYRDCRRLLVHTEGAVRRFARYHKYTVGTDLRQCAMGLMRCVHRAVHDRARVAEHVGALVWLVDDYKLNLQLAMEVGAFSPAAQGGAGLGSFNAFEQAATLAATIGKQCGGWRQSLLRSQRAPSGAPAPGPVHPGPQQQPLAGASPASLSDPAAWPAPAGQATS